ncbi:hypothetical protein MJT46_013377 [Ovis ammon polii x Ovis aries]|nr:hypothetical protein MJT46_013377 [Ovis ammon polii x Ovis aries]
MTQCEDMNVYYQERLPSPEKRRNYTGSSGISNQTGSPWRGKQSPRGRGAHEQLSQDDDQMCVTPQPVPSPPRHSASPALHLLPGQISAVADSLALNSDGHKSGRTGKREGDPTGVQPTEALLMPSQCLVPPNQFPPDPKPPLCWVCGASSWGLQQAMSSVHVSIRCRRSDEHAIKAWPQGARAPTGKLAIAKEASEVAISAGSKKEEDTKREERTAEGFAGAFSPAAPGDLVFLCVVIAQQSLNAIFVRPRESGSTPFSLPSGEEQANPRGTEAGDWNRGSALELPQTLTSLVHMTPDYSKTYIFHEGNSPHLLMTNPKNSTSSFFIFCELQSIPSDQLLKTRALVAGKLQYAEVKEIQLKRLKMKSNPVYENENLSQCKATGDVL